MRFDDEPGQIAIWETWEDEYRRDERERSLMELTAAFGPRPPVASVLRKLRLRRGRR